MNKSRKIYRRSLQVSGIVRLVMLGVIASIVAGAFVVVKNRQYALANERGAIEGEIASIDKQIETLDLRIAAMIDRDALAARLHDSGNELVKIEHAEKVIMGGDGGEQFASYRRSRSVRDEF
ncbi:MAG: putative TIM-barrel enzyme [Pseudoalteromonas tetraodonis]|jgi:predicted TIM-barrel enzyme